MLLKPARVAAASASLLVLIAGFSACSALDFSEIKTVCPGGHYALDIQVRDQFGQAQALGAKVTLIDGAYVELDSTFDTLHVSAASDRGGRTYDIRVSKRYYDDAVVSRVQTGGCVAGREKLPVTASVPVTLKLAADAPAIRAIHLLPVGLATLDRSPSGSSITPAISFDANPEVSRAVTWSISGNTISVPFDPASGRITYLCRPKTDSVTVMARSLVDATVFDTLVVRFQGHPGNSSDPVC